MTTQHDIAKTAFQDASAIIQHSGIGTAVENWLNDHVLDFPPHELDAEVALTGWLAAALAGLPLTDWSVTHLVNTFFDKYEVSEEQVREVTHRFLWTAKRAFPVTI
ncbi:hypothetical protein [Microbacterium sp. Leaf320]|uniref:hypothetical protein n=1 Tax=Microbacterium sp. Leaf320 TaxID=1736334 RepID=UPI0006F62969|nr:hypothetical protein [Microbacterium sp. Leaf320]KQQ65402.1 hypothetical protein ASF63_15820 [Microbacterium sp. Leaf320]